LRSGTLCCSGVSVRGFQKASTSVLIHDSVNVMPLKTCEHCRLEWMPKTRYQATRNRYCSMPCSLASRTYPRRKTPPETTCAVCGTAFHRPLSHRARVTTPVCSRRCNGTLRAKHLIRFSGNMKGRRRQPQYGASNPAWKGGVTFKRNKGNYIGPKYVRCPPEFGAMARSDGYVMEHRIVMARWVGRSLTRREVVHHEDHNTRRNERINLSLWPTNQSHKLHEGGRLAVGAANLWFQPVSGRLLNHRTNQSPSPGSHSAAP